LATSPRNDKLTPRDDELVLFLDGGNGGATARALLPSDDDDGRSSAREAPTPSVTPADGEDADLLLPCRRDRGINNRIGMGRVGGRMTKLLAVKEG
jgi:hypothetical protein